MRPILTPVLSKYKREHTSEVVLLEKFTSSDDSDGDQPRGPYSVAARQARSLFLLVVLLAPTSRVPTLPATAAPPLLNAQRHS